MDTSQALLYISALFATMLVVSVDGQCSDADGAKSTTLTLKRRLFCEYDKNAQPVKEHTTKTEVKMFLYPKFFVFYDFYSTLQVHSWMELVWTDETLTWNVTEYDNVETLKVPSNDIWVPDLDIDELSDNAITGHHVANVMCTLNHTGEIACLVGTRHSALCEVDASRWPFDLHTCTLSIQSWSRAESINLTASKYGGKLGLSTRLYKQSREWDMLNVSVVREEYLDDNNLEVSKLVYSLTLKRFSGWGTTTVVVPAIVLTILTWLAFLLKPRSAERLGVIYFNIVCHCSYLLHISLHIPPNGDSIPLLVLFYRDSLLMAGSSLIITVIVRKMNATSSSPPSWVTGVVNGVLATRLGQMLLLSGVETKDVAAVVDAGTAEGNGTNRWRLFGALVDYVSLASCIMASFILIIKCLL